MGNAQGAAPDKSPLLLGIDLEDVRHHMPHGRRFAPRVAAMVDHYLRFFAKHNVRTTFFTVGSVMRELPDVVRAVHRAGHEIACHTDRHMPLDEHTQASFTEDCQRFFAAASQLGIDAIQGFRAPVLSLTPRTAWAYDVLSRMGLRYSSSVLPAHSPLYGWPGHPTMPHVTPSGLWEIPVSLAGYGRMTVPFCAGTYLRALPAPLIDWAARQHARRQLPVVGYLHPYDIDVRQQRFMHPGIGNSQLYNWLMYYNRHSVFDKIERLLQTGLQILPYRDYIDQRLAVPIKAAG